MDNTFKYIFLSFTLMALSSCCFIPYPIREDLETAIDKEVLINIEREKTARLEIIEWFGPPDAIARAGTNMKIPPLTDRKEGSIDVKSQIFFDLFSDKYEINNKHIIYYYESSAFHGLGAVMMAVGAGGSGPISPVRLRSNRLWILIDTETGYVVDYIFREEGEDLEKERQEEKMEVKQEDYE